MQSNDHRTTHTGVTSPVHQADTNTLNNLNYAEQIGYLEKLNSDGIITPEGSVAPSILKLNFLSFVSVKERKITVLFLVLVSRKLVSLIL